jgi:hypothetical protein
VPLPPATPERALPGLDEVPPRALGQPVIAPLDPADVSRFAQPSEQLVDAVIQRLRSHFSAREADAERRRLEAPVLRKYTAEDPEENPDANTAYDTYVRVVGEFPDTDERLPMLAVNSQGSATWMNVGENHIARVQPGARMLAPPFQPAPTRARATVSFSNFADLGALTLSVAGVTWTVAADLDFASFTPGREARDWYDIVFASLPPVVQLGMMVFVDWSPAAATVTFQAMSHDTYTTFASMAASGSFAGVPATVTDATENMPAWSPMRVRGGTSLGRSADLSSAAALAATLPRGIVYIPPEEGETQGTLEAIATMESFWFEGDPRAQRVAVSRITALSNQGAYTVVVPDATVVPTLTAPGGMQPPGSESVAQTWGMLTDAGSMFVVVDADTARSTLQVRPLGSGLPPQPGDYITLTPLATSVHPEPGRGPRTRYGYIYDVNVTIEVFAASANERRELHDHLLTLFSFFEERSCYTLAGRGYTRPYEYPHEIWHAHQHQLIADGGKQEFPRPGTTTQLIYSRKLTVEYKAFFYIDREVQGASTDPGAGAGAGAVTVSGEAQ